MRRPATQLLLDSLDSAAQFEILAVLCASGERWWSAKDLAARLRLATSSTSLALEALSSLGLLDVRITADVRYRFAPNSPDLAGAVSELMDDYRANPSEVLNHFV